MNEPLHPCVLTFNEHDYQFTRFAAVAEDEGWVVFGSPGMIIRNKGGRPLTRAQAEAIADALNSAARAGAEAPPPEGTK